MKWQSKCVIEADNYHLRKKMDKLGEKGWEAYSTICNHTPFTETYIAYLKRPKHESRKRVPRHTR